MMYSFEETQKFRQWWLWLIIIVCLIVSILVPIIVTMSEGQANLFHDGGIIIICIVPALTVFMLLVSNLKTRIDGTGIYYSFFPFVLKEKKIDWLDVSQAYVRKYNPLGEFGGWGLRYSFRYGRAVNVSGNMGLQLVMKTGKKLLIGTQKPDELNELVQQLINDKMITVEQDKVK